MFGAVERAAERGVREPARFCPELETCIARVRKDPRNREGRIVRVQGNRQTDQRTQSCVSVCGAGHSRGALLTRTVSYIITIASLFLPVKLLTVFNWLSF